MSYQPAVYREQGGDKLVAASSGEIEFQSGSVLDIQSGSSCSCATDFEIASGGRLAVKSGGIVNFASGSYWQVPIQTLTSTQTATNATNFGMTVLSATTTGPTYTLAAPVVGLTKYLAITHTSSGATHRAVLRSNTTGVAFDTTGGNQITFATSALRAVTLVAQTTAAWKIVGTYSGASLAAPRTT